MAVFSANLFGPFFFESDAKYSKLEILLTSLSHLDDDAHENEPIDGRIRQKIWKMRVLIRLRPQPRCWLHRRHVQNSNLEVMPKRFEIWQLDSKFALELGMICNVHQTMLLFGWAENLLRPRRLAHYDLKREKKYNLSPKILSFFSVEKLHFS